MNAQTQKNAPGIFTTDLDTLERGPVKIQGPIALDWLDHQLAECEYPITSDSANIAISLEKMDAGILVKGTVTARLTTECGTCLSPVQLDLDGKVSNFLIHRSKAAEGTDGEELTPEDLEREWFEGPTIILDDLIRDVIMLELPMNPRCAGECIDIPGLAKEEPTKKVDPRLAPLADIKLSKEK